MTRSSDISVPRSGWLMAGVVAVVLALIATGEAKFTCCQPAAVSLVNVAWARSSPEPLHRRPTWVPVFWLLL